MEDPAGFGASLLLGCRCLAPGEHGENVGEPLRGVEQGLDARDERVPPEQGQEERASGTEHAQFVDGDRQGAQIGASGGDNGVQPGRRCLDGKELMLVDVDRWRTVTVDRHAHERLPGFARLDVDVDDQTVAVQSPSGGIDDRDWTISRSPEREPTVSGCPDRLGDGFEGVVAVAEVEDRTIVPSGVQPQRAVDWQDVGVDRQLLTQSV